MAAGERGPRHAREQRAAKCSIDIGSVERHQLGTGDVIENRLLINQAIADQVNFAVVIGVRHLPDFVRCRTARGHWHCPAHVSDALCSRVVIIY